MKELKQFDLEAAKRGDPICFEDGESLHFIGVAVSGLVVAQRKHGGTFLEFGFSELRMAPKKCTVFFNLGEDGLWHEHESKSIAERAAERLMYEGKKYIAIAVPVEIEE